MALFKLCFIIRVEKEGIVTIKKQLTIGITAVALMTAIIASTGIGILAFKASKEIINYEMMQHLVSQLGKTKKFKLKTISRILIIRS